MSGRNQNGDDYKRRFVNWADRPSNSPAARFDRPTVERLHELNEWLDAHQAEGVVSEAEGLCAAEVRCQAAKAAGWKAGEPGE